MIDWTAITPNDFERLCGDILEANDFNNIEWYGKGGGDKGRDLTATKTVTPISGLTEERKWVVQCKRYTEKAVTKTVIEEFLTSAREHNPDSTLMITNATLSSNVRDWFKTVRSKYDFDCYIWEERDLIREIRTHRSKLTVAVPNAPPGGEPEWFYHSYPTGSIYMGGFGEFEEVGFFIMNTYDPEGEVQLLERFIEYIRNNEIRFNGRRHD